MKKIRICIPLFAIAVLVIGLLFDGVIPNTYSLSYNEQVANQKNNMWQLGKNLAVGDSYTYKICDPKTIQTSAANYRYFTQGNDDHNDSVCYTIKMDFVNLLNSNENQINRDIWVVQAAFDDNSALNDGLRYSVFHVDTKTFEVRSDDTIHPDTKKYADSLQKTLFSLHKYTVPEPQLLQIGVGWGEVTEALGVRGNNPHMTVLDNNQEFSIVQHHLTILNTMNEFVTRDITDAFQVVYEIDIFDPFVLSDDKKRIVEADEEEDTNNVTTSFLITTDLPFPLSAESFNPVYTTQPQKQYEFKLVTFFTSNKNIDLGIKPVVVVIPDDDIEDLPIVERGTIELTFPDDDVKVIADDDVKVIADDDVKVIADDDVKVIGDTNDPNADDGGTDYSNILGLAVLLVLMIVGFTIFKKLKSLGFKNGLEKTIKKNGRNNSATKAVIPFDETLHIEISSKRKTNHV